MTQARPFDEGAARDFAGFLMMTFFLMMVGGRVVGVVVGVAVFVLSGKLAIDFSRFAI